MEYLAKNIFIAIFPNPSRSFITAKKDAENRIQHFRKKGNEILPLQRKIISKLLISVTKSCVNSPKSLPLGNEKNRALSGTLSFITDVCN